MSLLASDRVRLALIVSLSIMTSFAISMSMGWTKPYWAGMAIAMCSLATRGESVFKGIQRLAGTAVAVVIALILISTLSQDRWSYALVVSLWLAFCSYRMQASSTYYFWYCSGFIVVLLTMMSGFESQRSFYVVIERAQETVLGLLCYIAYSTALSRQEATHAFRAKVQSQLALLAGRIEAMRSTEQAMRDRAPDRDSRRAINNITLELPTLHASAVLESFDIRERAGAWSQFLAELSRLALMLDRLDLSFLALRSQPDPADQKPLDTALDIFADRCRTIDRILTDKVALPIPEQLTILATEAPADTRLSPFVAGEARLRRETLRAIDHATRELHAWALDISDIRRHSQAVAPLYLPETFWPNPEFMLRSVTQFITFWAAFLMFIYVPALPDGPIVAMLGAVFSMNVMRQPWMKPLVMLVPIVIAILFGGLTHILIMPALDGFAGLGTMLFSCTFLIAYFLHTPQLQPLRGIGISQFLMALQISNQNQAYSATYVFNMIVAIAMLLLLIQFFKMVPISWRPEAVVQRLIRRYADSLDALLHGLRRDDARFDSWFARQRRLAHMRQLATLPGELANWIDKLDTTVFPEAEKVRLHQLAEQLAVLSHRMFDLVWLRDHKSDGRFLALLAPEVAKWRAGLGGLIAALRSQDTAIDIDDLNRRLTQRVASLDSLVAGAVNGGPLADATPHSVVLMQEVLSAYRGVSLALIDTAARTRNANWPLLAETRF